MERTKRSLWCNEEKGTMCENEKNDNSANV